MTSIRQLAIRGTVWTIASYGISQAIRLGSNLFLARLLAPEVFGLMSLVMVFIVGIHLFSDIGVGPSIVQNKRGDDPKFLDTAWTLQIIRSLIVWALCVAIAFPVSRWIYPEVPQLLWLIPIVSFGIMISGFGSTALYTLQRQMEMQRSTLFNLGNQIISIGILIIWAALSPTIWALVLGGLVSSVIGTIWSHFLIPTKNRFAWEPEAAKEIFRFGKWIFFSTAITFLAEQVDRLMLGKLIPLELLGIYGIAYTLSDIPRQALSTVSSKVFFPVFAKMADLPRDEFRAKILKNRLPLLLASAAGLMLVVSFGDLIITTLYQGKYGAKYAQAAWMLPVLALGIWPRVLTQTIDHVFLAFGKPNYPAYGYVCKFLFMIVALPTAFHFFGLPGAILVVALNDLPFYAVITYGLFQEKLPVLRQDVLATLLFLSLTAIVITSRYFLGFGLPIKGLLT